MYNPVYFTQQDGSTPSPFSLVVRSVTNYYGYRQANAAVGEICKLYCTNNTIFNRFWDDIVELAKECGVKASRENHSVFEVTGTNGNRFFLHFSDGKIYVSARCSVPHRNPKSLSSEERYILTQAQDILTKISEGNGITTEDGGSADRGRLSKKAQPLALLLQDLLD